MNNPFKAMANELTQFDLDSEIWALRHINRMNDDEICELLWHRTGNEYLLERFNKKVCSCCNGSGLQHQERL